MEGLPDELRWVYVGPFGARSYAKWVPTTPELERLAQDYKTAMELVIRFKDNPHQASYAAMLREKVMKEQLALIHTALDYQLEQGLITQDQHDKMEIYCPYLDCVEADF